MPTASRTESVQAIFVQAVEQPAERRSAFLASACGQDAALRAEVETLLRLDSAAEDGFLRPPDLSAGVLAPTLAEGGPDPLIGQRIGRYHIKSRIARGGMGSVYEATQESPHRVVALKVMHGNVASRSASRRFEFEAQVLGRLRHPNIAQVFEAGLAASPQPLPEREGGIPYFAMEYIPGARPITQFARDANLSVRRRVELFIKVCNASHHAHQKGIIHRDLKPTNILADSAGEPKIIDFGVARATDSDLALTSAQTCIGHLIGTVQYMSPEQCDGDPHDIDIRSDVYSLGVVLYELLTAELPYQATGTTLYAATRAIKEDEPRRPSATTGGMGVPARQLRGDLETIILTALAKRREQRYQSAADLGRDLSHWLNREPIEARPPTTWTRVAKWMARHPALVTTALCLSIAVTILACTWIAFQAVNERAVSIWTSADAGIVEIRAANGRPLVTWGGGGAGSNRGALGNALIGTQVRLPKSLGGGQGVVAGFSGVSNARNPNSLCLFAFEDLDTPKWARQVETSDLPKNLRLSGLVGGDFSVERGIVADVFPDIPAVHGATPEIVVAFKCQRSQRLLRIYDLEGNVHWQRWYDGSIGGVYWMSAPGLLVVAGENAADDGQPLPAGKSMAKKPLVVIAVRPEAGMRTDGWLGSQPPDEPGSSLAWHRRVFPMELPPDCELALSAPLQPEDAARTVQLSVVFHRGRNQADMAWVVDEHGRSVPGTRWPNDTYRTYQGELPDPADFGLGPLHGGTEADISRP